MNNIFILIFFISYATLISIRTYYIKKYHFYKKVIIQRNFKKYFIILLLTICWISSIFFFMISYDFFSVDIKTPIIIKIFFSLLMIPNILLFVYSHRSLEENWDLPTEKSNSLVDKKAYKIIRHPIYLTILFFSLYLIIISENITVIILQIFIIILTIYNMFEEEYKLKITLTGYDNYMKRTKRLIPFIF